MHPKLVLSLLFSVSVLAEAYTPSTLQLDGRLNGESHKFSAKRPRQGNPNCQADFFESTLPRDAELESVAVISNGSSYGEGSRNPAYPTNTTDLPELCAVVVRVATSPSSAYRFGLFLPTKWNHRFLAVGNGGFGGGINWLAVGAGVRYGFAAVSTDTGHNSTSDDLTWALNQPEKKKDFGYRAMHGSVVLSKLLIRAYYGDGPMHSYYSGCSTGGRQGLKEAQLFADSFDGLLIGAPAWWGTGLAVWTTRIGVSNLPPSAPSHISPDHILALSREVMRQCDLVDGVEDGIISAPERCSIDYTKIACSQPGVDASLCFTDAQLQTVKKAYADYVIDGQLAFLGLLPGSEDLWGALMSQPVPDARGKEYIKMFLLDDAEWDWRKFNDSIMALAAAADPGAMTADYFNISKFRDRGGKIIMYHGDADGIIPARSSDYYYNKTAEAMGGLAEIRPWFRYFHVPGVGHCAGTRVDAPWYFGGANQAGAVGTGTYSVPGFPDPEHDALLALVEWVEGGRVVNSIVATTWKNPMDPASGILRQRPLCPVPESATFDPDGNEKNANSWRCM